MKPNFIKTDNPEFDSLLVKLNRILSGINLDNLQYRYVSGTTAGVAKTQYLIYHGMPTRPWIILPYESTGNIYVFSIGNDTVDIRSTQTSIDFTVLILG